MLAAVADRPRRQHRAGRPDLLHRRHPQRGAYHAVDITNTTKPKLIATFNISNLGLAAATTVHGLSISNDGNRAYAVVLGGPPFGAPPAPMTPRA